MIDIWILLYIIDGLLFIGAAATVLYMLVFAIAALLYKRTNSKKAKKQNRFIVLIPAYKADEVVLSCIHSVLGQTYPQRMFDIVVISDHQQEMTNFKIAQLPVTLLTPDFDYSTKARSLQYAMKNLPEFKIYDIVLVVNADNIMDSDFLDKLNIAYESSGTKAIQVHRMSRNRDTSASRMAATFDEINNSIFRLGHIALGLSSSIMSSGIALDFKWFKEHVGKLSSAIEDKEIEAMLFREDIFVDYFDDIQLFEEKAHSVKELHEKQGKYISAELNSFLSNLKHVPSAIMNKQIDFLDKMFQWIMVPRTILVTVIALMSILMACIYMTLAIKWWVLGALVTFVFALAVPDYIVDKNFDKTFAHAPIIMAYSLLNLIRANRSLSSFINSNVDTDKKKSKKKSKIER